MSRYVCKKNFKNLGWEFRKQKKCDNIKPLAFHFHGSKKLRFPHLHYRTFNVICGQVRGCFCLPPVFLLKYYFLIGLVIQTLFYSRIIHFYTFGPYLVNIGPESPQLRSSSWRGTKVLIWKKLFFWGRDFTL